MTAILRRVGKLEDRFALNSGGLVRIKSAADVLWERRQRRLKEEGLPFETIRLPRSPGPYLSAAEVLRKRRQERAARHLADQERANVDA